MIAFDEKHKGDGRYAILTFHDNTVRTLNGLDRRLKEVGCERKTFPLPILLDTPAGDTWRDWDAASTMIVLIDPAGKIRTFSKKRGGAEEVLAVLEDELARGKGR